MMRRSADNSVSMSWVVLQNATMELPTPAHLAAQNRAERAQRALDYPQDLPTT